MTTQKYTYKEKEFVVTKPETCAMEVSRDDYKAVISIHSATNNFRESLDGWGSDHATLKRALDSACQRILDKAASPPKEELCSEMDEFYKSLDQ